MFNLPKFIRAGLPHVLIIDIEIMYVYNNINFKNVPNLQGTNQSFSLVDDPQNEETLAVTLSLIMYVILFLSANTEETCWHSIRDGRWHTTVRSDIHLRYFLL